MDTKETCGYDSCFSLFCWNQSSEGIQYECGKRSGLFRAHLGRQRSKGALARDAERTFFIQSVFFLNWGIDAGESDLDSGPRLRMKDRQKGLFR